jgi:hypothetical protein
VVYFTRTNVLDVSASYSTPLSLISDRLKLGVGGEYSVFGRFANAGLTWHAGRPSRPSGLDLGFGYNYVEFDSSRGLSPKDYLDTLDEVGGRVGKLQASARHQYATRSWQGSEELRLAAAAPRFASDSAFWRANLELRQTWRPIRDLRVELRFFGGYAGGSPPPQEQYFLSGNLYGTPDEPLTWPAWDLASTQAHWHVNGDANLRGYITGHIRGRYAAALNLGLPSRYVVPFFDVGNVGNSLAVFAPENLRMDAGLRVQFGPIYADFPIWANRPLQGSPLALRWMVGLRISGLGNLF